MIRDETCYTNKEHASCMRRKSEKYVRCIMLYNKSTPTYGVTIPTAGSTTYNRRCTAVSQDKNRLITIYRSRNNLNEELLAYLCKTETTAQEYNATEKYAPGGA